MNVMARRLRRLHVAAWLALAAILSLGAGPGSDAPTQESSSLLVMPSAAGSVFGSGAGSESSIFRTEVPADQRTTPALPPVPAPSPGAFGKPVSLDPREALRNVPILGLYALFWLAPGAVMVTAFVRINIVLVLLRQALGSPQVPGNQVLMVLALLLTALVMRPVGQRIYDQAIVPYNAGRATAEEAWRAGSTPIKTFMVDQIVRTGHQDYLWTLYDYAAPPSPSRPEPKFGQDFPLRVVAPAYLLSELATALLIGFYVYLPFLVVDLVVAAVLASMGLYMLPPSLVAMPLKLIVFVLADGWLLIASMLLKTFAVAGSS
jgi:flagellar biosynthetic protein FliP